METFIIVAFIIVAFLAIMLAVSVTILFRITAWNERDIQMLHRRIDRLQEVIHG